MCAWYSGAVKRELQPESDAQAAITPTQLILHSIAAPWTGERIYQYWRDSTNLESHFGLEFGGALFQYIGTNTRADANAQANVRAVSVETASNLQHTDPWTNAQITSLIRLGVWMHQHHGLPLQVCKAWDGPGYGYHRLFPQWAISGTACPGDARAEQFYDLVFPGIVAAAGGTVPPTPPVTSVSLHRVQEASFSNPPATGAPITYTGVIHVERALVSEGLLNPSLSDGHYGTATVTAYAAWQRRLGYSGDAADGHPGSASLSRLGALHGFRMVA
jgi:hypothetical protein